MTDIKTLILEGKCKWAVVHESRKNLNGEEEYSIDIEISQGTLDNLLKAGVSKRRKAKEDAETGEKYLTIRRKKIAKSGKEIPPPIVVGPDKQLFTDKIGNGSKVKVAVELIPYENKFGTGVMTRLAGVQVITHVSYSAGRTTALDLFKDETGGSSTSDAFDDTDGFI